MNKHSDAEYFHTQKCRTPIPTTVLNQQAVCHSLFVGKQDFEISTHENINFRNPRWRQPPCTSKSKLPVEPPSQRNDLVYNFQFKEI